MSNTITSIKSTIIDAVGHYNASGYSYIIDPAAQAILNRGDKTVREAIVETIGAQRASQYSTYIDSVVAALEAADNNPTSDADADETSEGSLKDIRSTIEDVLGSVAAQYPEYVDKVVEALTEREYVIAERVAQTVVANTNFSAEDVQSYGEAAGLTFRPVIVPEPVIEDEDDDFDGDTSAGANHDHAELDEAVDSDSAVEVAEPVAKGKKAKRIAELEKRVAGIETNVSELLALAKRHLGA